MCVQDASSSVLLLFTVTSSRVESWQSGQLPRALTTHSQSQSKSSVCPNPTRHKAIDITSLKYTTNHPLLIPPIRPILSHPIPTTPLPKPHTSPANPNAIPSQSPLYPIPPTQIKKANIISHITIPKTRLVFVKSNRMETGGERLTSDYTYIPTRTRTRRQRKKGLLG